MKPTLEQIQAALSGFYDGDIIVVDNSDCGFDGQYFKIMKYALELAEQVAKGEVVLVETGNYAAMLSAMPRELKQMLPQPPQEASDERD